MVKSALNFLRQARQALVGEPHAGSDDDAGMAVVCCRMSGAEAWPPLCFLPNILRQQLI
jgi:hypothetical protein